jgi:hypothetical protein
VPSGPNFVNKSYGTVFSLQLLVWLILLDHGLSADFHGLYADFILLSSHGIVFPILQSTNSLIIEISRFFQVWCLSRAIIICTD